jgi:putative flippase GtrA
LNKLYHQSVFEQVPLFLLCSGIAALANLTAGYLLYQGLGLNQGRLYGLSVALAALVGMSVSFVLNRHLTFERSGRRARDEMQTFFLVSVIGLGLTVGVSHLLRGLVLPALLLTLGLTDWRPALNLELLAHAGAVGLVGLYSFLAHKYLSFGQGIRPWMGLK